MKPASSDGVSIASRITLLVELHRFLYSLQKLHALDVVRSQLHGCTLCDFERSSCEKQVIAGCTAYFSQSCN